MQTNAIGTKEGVVMKCPVCKSPELRATDLEDGLTFHNCPQCRGNWIRGAEYWKWLEQHGPNLPERSDQDTGLSLAEPGLQAALGIIVAGTKPSILQEGFDVETFMASRQE